MERWFASTTDAGHRHLGHIEAVKQEL
jgi:hypothetical protein